MKNLWRRALSVPGEVTNWLIFFATVIIPVFVILPMRTSNESDFSWRSLQGLCVLAFIIYIVACLFLATSILLFRVFGTTIKMHPEGPTGKSDPCYRVRVENLTGDGRQFGVDLIKIDPRVDLPLPLPLQITHEPEKTMSFLFGLHSRLVDVFRCYATDEGVISILGVHHAPQIPKQQYKLTIVAYFDKSHPKENSFIIAPCPDGTVDFRITNPQGEKKSAKAKQASVYILL